MPKTPHLRIEYTLVIAIFLLILISSSALFFYLGTRFTSNESEDTEQLEAEIILQNEEIQRLNTALLEYKSGNLVDINDDPNVDDSLLGETYRFRSDTGLVQFDYPKDWVLNKRRDPSTVSSDAYLYTLTSPRGSKLYYHEATSNNDSEEAFCNSTDPTGSYTENTYSCVFFRDSDTQFARYKKLELSIPEGEWFLTESIGSGIYKADPTSYFTYEIEEAEDLQTMDDIVVTIIRKK